MHLNLKKNISVKQANYKSFLCHDGYVVFLSFRSRTHFKSASLFSKATRKSQKVFPLVKIVEKYGGAPIHSNYDVMCFM